jgi:hypothetical protein
MRGAERSDRAHQPFPLQGRSQMDSTELAQWYARGRRDFAGTYLRDAEMSAAPVPGVDLSGSDL